MTETKNLLIPLKKAKTAADPEIEDAGQVADLVSDMQITDQTGLEVATAFTAQVKIKKKEIETKQKSFIDPLNKVVKELKAFFEPAIDNLTTAEKELKTKIEKYVTWSFGERDALLKKMEHTPQNERSELLAAAQALEPGKVDGMRVQETWGGEIEDLEMLVRWAVYNRQSTILSINEKALVEMTKKANGKIYIPGWKPKPIHTVVITISKVKT